MNTTEKINNTLAKLKTLVVVAQHEEETFTRLQALPTDKEDLPRMVDAHTVVARAAIKHAFDQLFS